MAKPNVGRSWRTPIKHDYTWSIVGQEAGAIAHLGAQTGAWYDLTAGDAALIPGKMWHRACSPGILAFHASQCPVPVRVRLHEIQPATYDRLLSNLSTYLPALGYGPTSPNTWAHPVSGSTVTAHNISGSDADVSDIDRDTAVFVVNDPNAITEWAMRPTFAAEIATKTWLSRCLSTMGCNPGGIMRGPLAGRIEWFATVREQQRAMPEYRDLSLAALDRDEAKWAYRYRRRRSGAPRPTRRQRRAPRTATGPSASRGGGRTTTSSTPSCYGCSSRRRSWTRSAAASASGWPRATNSDSR